MCTGRHSVGGVIVLSRFQVGPADTESFVESAQAAVAVLAQRTGFRTADLARNLDEPTLWTITTRWRDVGSYRRALTGYESKVAVVPLLSRAIDEPSPYEDNTILSTFPDP